MSKSNWGWNETHTQKWSALFKHFILIISRISTRKELILPDKKSKEIPRLIFFRRMKNQVMTN